MSAAPLGCYGLELNAWPGTEHLLLSADPSWAHLEITTGELPVGLAPAIGVGAAQADVALIGGRLQMHREPLEATFLVERPLDAQALVHPYLAMAAGIASHWLGRQAFHAGAFVVDGGAWAILGEKEGGKSSTLAWLDSHGFEVLADDLLVVADGTALAGPRCIDLRASAAAALGIGTRFEGADGRDRWRLVTRATAAATPLRGWVVPAWADTVAIESMPAMRRVLTVLEHRSVLTMDQDAEVFLDLAARPCLRFARPHGMDRMGDAIEALLATLPR